MPPNLRHLLEGTLLDFGVPEVRPFNYAHPSRLHLVNARLHSDGRGLIIIISISKKQKIEQEVKNTARSKENEEEARRKQKTLVITGYTSRCCYADMRQIHNQHLQDM